MGYTNTTPNLKLPLYVATDKPSYLGDWNVTQGLVDTAVTGVKNSITTTDTNLTTLQNIVNQNTSNVTAHQSWLGKMGINSDLTATQFNTKVDGATTDATTAITGVNKNTGDITKLSGRVSGNEAEIQTIKNTKAPNDHAVSTTTYGGGTASLYGHVKLSDSTTSASNVSSYIAATPLAVKTVQDALGLIQATVVSLTNQVANIESKVNANPIQVDLSVGNYNTKMIYDKVADFVTIRTHAITTYQLQPGQVVNCGTVPAAQRPTITLTQLVNSGSYESAKYFAVFLIVNPDGSIQLKNSGTSQVGIDSANAYVIGYYDINGVV